MAEKLERVVGAADEIPFPSDALQSAQAEVAQAACFLDLAKTDSTMVLLRR